MKKPKKRLVFSLIILLGLAGFVTLFESANAAFANDDQGSCADIFKK